MYLMCGPRQLFFQCGTETPKGWKPLARVSDEVRIEVNQVRERESESPPGHGLFSPPTLMVFKDPGKSEDQKYTSSLLPTLKSGYGHKTTANMIII